MPELLSTAPLVDEQIVRILLAADRDSIAEVVERNGVSEASIYAWRKRFGEMARNTTVWRYDFVIDACANGPQLKCQTVIDVLARLIRWSAIRKTGKMLGL
jgi:hypothetical protein